jgi:hypothetical protein
MASKDFGGYIPTKVQFYRQIMLHKQNKKFCCNFLWVLFCKKKGTNTEKVSFTGEQKHIFKRLFFIANELLELPKSCYL